jgi:hemerythrin-like domain-containing protein
MEKYEQMKTEHHQIRHVVDAIRNGDTDVALITEFHTLLEKHIRFEERDLFPFIQDHIQPEQLNDLGKNLHDLESKACSDYPVKFWE